jgi:hypothetical protein
LKPLGQAKCPKVLISAAIRMPGNIGLSGHIAVKITGRLI